MIREGNRACICFTDPMLLPIVYLILQCIVSGEKGGFTLFDLEKFPSWWSITTTKHFQPLSLAWHQTWPRFKFSKSDKGVSVLKLPKLVFWVGQTWKSKPHYDDCLARHWISKASERLGRLLPLTSVRLAVLARSTTTSSIARMAPRRRYALRSNNALSWNWYINWNSFLKQLWCINATCLEAVRLVFGSWCRKLVEDERRIFQID